jgi:hypothetical protein
MWPELTHDYFTVLGGVKQGAVICPILFCIHIDDVLARLSRSWVGLDLLVAAVKSTESTCGV